MQPARWQLVDGTYDPHYSMHRMAVESGWIYRITADHGIGIAMCWVPFGKEDDVTVDFLHERARAR